MGESAGLSNRLNTAAASVSSSHGMLVGGHTLLPEKGSPGAVLTPPSRAFVPSGVESVPPQPAGHSG